MNVKPLLAALVGVAMSASAGNALTINNQDDVSYVLEIVEGEGDVSVEMIDLEANQVVEDICNSGCTITLSNGESQSFLGDESVTVVEGKFVLSN